MLVDGAVAGRRGSFALRTTGVYDGAVRAQRIVVQGSGTGELAEITGTGSYVVRMGEKEAKEAVLELEF
jgi:hypothetical protein